MVKIEYCITNAHYTHFNALEISDQNIYNILLGLYDYLNLKKYGILKENFERFVKMVRENYTQTFYHNFKHACDVVISILHMTIKIKNKEMIDSVQKIGIVLGALLHDVGHYGRTGKYVSEYDKEKYEKFGKNSTLEKYHLNFGIKLIEESKLFSGVTKNNTNKIKNIIKIVILATDPNLKLKNIMEDNRNQLIIILIRCADISSVLKNFKTHKKWALSLIKEFCEEGNDLRSKHGVTTIPTLFENNMEHLIPNEQIKFYEIYVKPHFFVLKKYIYVNSYIDIWSKIQENKEKWVKEK